jgi:hypothetical protein
VPSTAGKVESSSLTPTPDRMLIPFSSRGIARYRHCGNQLEVDAGITKS